MRYLSPILLFVIFVACGGGGGSDDDTPPPTSNDRWLVDTDFVLDGGPGKDGIPALDNPTYVAADQANFIQESDLVIGININNQIRAYPHAILNWHEVANVQTGDDYHVLSYCPLTGSAGLWAVPDSFGNKTFGVSGLLFNSNLIMYDRETDSNWPQMFAQSANGSLIGTRPEILPVIETTWATWRSMYPNTTVLSDDTGFSRNYNSYPYGSYLTDSNLLFAVSETDDRLHPKTRVLGISDSSTNKVYEIANFATNVQVINEDSNSSPYVVIGSSSLNFAIAFDSTTADSTVLTFTALDSALPIVMQDNEGNQWDIFGTAVSGPRMGEQLTMRSDFIAFWFSWVPLYPNPDIHSF